MRTAKEILKESEQNFNNKSITKAALLAINTARKEAIEECAKRAIVESIETSEQVRIGYGFTSDGVIPLYGNKKIYEVNQHSILNLITELK